MSNRILNRFKMLMKSKKNVLVINPIDTNLFKFSYE